MRQWREFLFSHPNGYLWRLLRGLRRGHIPSLLGLAFLLSAPTWPNDDLGRPAGQCSFIGSDGITPTLCSTANPLPSAPATTSTTDPTGWGKLIVAPIFTPATFFPIFESDQEITGIGITAPTLTIRRSADGGITYPVVATVPAANLPHANFNSPLFSALKLTTGQYVIGAGTNPGAVAANSPIWTTTAAASSPWTGATVTGAFVPPTVNNPVAFLQQGSTILALINNSTGAGTAARICRSTNAGATWACVNPTGGVSYVGGPFSGGLASPSVSIWLAIDNSTPANLIRSTDDGVTWTLITTLVRNGGGAAHEQVTCLSATICLATATDSIYRSTDAGLTWVQVVRNFGANVTTIFSGSLLNFGSGIVVGIQNDGGTGDGIRSSDFGASWSIIPIVGPGAPATLTSLAYLAATRNGRAVWIPDSAVASNLYTPIITGPTLKDQFGAAQGTLTNPLFERLTDGVNSQGVVGNPFFNRLSDGISAQGNIGNPLFTRLSDGVNSQGSTANPLGSLPTQGATLFNTQATSAANATNVFTCPAVAGTRCILRGGSGSLSAAGTASILVQDGATTILSSPGALAPLTATVATNLFPFGVPPSGLTGTTGNAMTITLGAPGVGVTSTAAIQMDRE